MSYKTTDEFLKMFGYSSLKDLPELPRYKLDSNQQIVIDDLVESEGNTNNETKSLNNEKANAETGNMETIDTVNREEINQPHSKQEAPMPERGDISNFQE